MKIEIGKINECGETEKVKINDCRGTKKVKINECAGAFLLRYMNVLKQNLCRNAFSMLTSCVF